jgi:hypothetical protein
VGSGAARLLEINNELGHPKNATPFVETIDVDNIECGLGNAKFCHWFGSTLLFPYKYLLYHCC